MFPDCMERREVIAIWCLSLQIQGEDVGEVLLWSLSLSVSFLALFPCNPSNMFAVSTVDRPHSFCLPRTEVLGQLLLGSAMLRGCFSFCAESALMGHGRGDRVVTGICWSVLFADRTGGYLRFLRHRENIQSPTGDKKSTIIKCLLKN